MLTFFMVTGGSFMLMLNHYRFISTVTGSFQHRNRNIHGGNCTKWFFHGNRQFFHVNSSTVKVKYGSLLLSGGSFMLTVALSC